MTVSPVSCMLKNIMCYSIEMLTNTSSTFRIGLQSKAELLMYTMPIRDTVAGEALSMLWGSKRILQFGAMGIRSPLARVRVLLSSSTEFRFSIQMASTGPSIISQINSPVKNTQICHPQVNKLDVKLQCKQIYYDNLTGIFLHHFQSSISTLIQLFENCQLPY